VLFIDVDRFKAVNDAHGHHVGDELLIRVAGRLSAALRPGDTLARLSGDEFVVLCEDLGSTAEAVAIAGRVVQAMALPVRVDDVELHVGVSVGVATTFDGPEVAESLLLHADAAMYRAKRRGGRQLALADGTMGQDVERRRSVVRDLRDAIAGGGLELHYQRIVDAADGHCSSVEALLRWRHPVVGDIPPPLIVDVAESTGAAPELTSWVLNTAAGQLRRWRDEEGDDLTVAVNVTAAELTHARFVPALRHALAAARLPGDALCLEITESTLIHDVPAALEALAQVRRLGVAIAIDDFGTGYSSLSYLKRFPVQAIKIDRSFVSALAAEPIDRAIVRAIVQLAETLGLTIVAEGVETEDQLAVVDRLGCHRIQGHLFSTPRPGHEVFMV
jgi:diguanylate cyclase (GGDEF)-like protein